MCFTLASSTDKKHPKLRYNFLFLMVVLFLDCISYNLIGHMTQPYAMDTEGFLFLETYLRQSQRLFVDAETSKECF